MLSPHPPTEQTSQICAISMKAETQTRPTTRFYWWLIYERRAESGVYKNLAWRFRQIYPQNEHLMNKPRSRRNPRGYNIFMALACRYTPQGLVTA